MASLTPQEKEEWAGVRRAGGGTTSVVEEEKKKLESNIDWSTYQSDITGTTVTSYDEHSTYVQNNAGFSQSEAATLNDKIKNNFNSWSDYETYVQDTDSWDGWTNAFGMSNSFGSGLNSPGGGRAAGIRTFDRAGKTYNGIDVPAGTVEIFGQEIHHSQRAAAATIKTDVAYSNLVVSDTTPAPLQTVDISADLINNGDAGTESVRLLEDGEQVDSKDIEIGSGEAVTVTFERSWDEYQSVDITIDGLDPITVSVVPPQLI